MYRSRFNGCARCWVFTKEEARDLKFELEKTALHCSHAIVAARYVPEWPPRPLMDVSKWH